MGSDTYLGRSLIHPCSTGVREDLRSDLERASAAPTGSGR